MTPSSPRKLIASIVSAAVLAAAVPLSPRALHAEELTPAQKQEYVKSGFQKGKTFYDEGRYEEAFAAWAKIEPMLEETSSVRKVITFLKQRAGQTAPRRAQASAPAVPPAASTVVTASGASPASAPIQTPDELTAVLDRAREDLRAESERARQTSDEAAQRGEEARLRVDASVRKGKGLYEAGRYEEAIEEWRKLLPDVADADRLRERLDALRSELDRVARLRSAPVQTSSSDRPSSELDDFFASALDRIREESERLEGENRRRSEAAAREGEEARRTQRIFDEGRKLYEQGAYEKAVQSWKGLQGREGVPADLMAKLGEMDRAASRLSASKRQSSSPSLPATGAAFDAAEAQRFFETATKRFEADLAVAQARGAESSRPAQERQQLARAGFERGRLLYYQGDYVAALDEWERIVPLLEKGSDVASRIQSLRRLVDETASAREAASAPAPTQVPVPAELLSSIDQAEKKLKTELWESQSKKSRLLESGKEQEAQVRRSVLEADGLFRKGRYAEAVAEWEKVLPSLESSSQVRIKLEQLKLQISNLSVVRKESESLSLRGDAAPSVPAKEMMSYLEQASAQVASEAAKAQEQKAQLAKTVEERQAWAAKVFQDGRASYDRGDFDAAFDQWNKLFVYLKDQPQLSRDLEALKIRYQSARSAKLEAERGAAESKAALRAPDGFAEALAAASARFESEEAAAKALQVGSQQALSARQVEMAKAFERGKTLMGQGNAEGAVREWEKMVPLADAATAERIRGLAARAEDARQAQKKAQELESLKAKGLPAPTELAASLSQAERVLSERVEAAERQAAQAKGSEQERADRVDRAYRAGLELLQKGDPDGAIAKWREIAPQLEGGTQILAKLDQLSANSAAARDARARMEKAVGAQGAKMPAPRDLLTALEKATQEMDRAAKDADARRAAAENALSQRRQRLDDLYARGDQAYRKGQYEEALKLWSGLVPEIEGASGVERALLAASEERAALAEAAQRAEAARASSAAKLPPPQGFESSLAGAIEAMGRETEKADLSRQSAEKALQQRQSQVQQRFSQGQAAFAQGRYEEGLEAWRAMADQIGEDPTLSQGLEKLRGAHRRMLDSKKQAVRAASEDFKGLKLPDGLAAELERAEAKLLEEERSAADRIQAASQSLEEKRRTVGALFENGRKSFEQGRHAEAVKAWQGILPYLEAQSPAKVLLERLAERSQRAEAAREAAVRAQAAEMAGIELSAASASTLEDVAERLAAETASAQEAAARASQARSAREAALSAAFEKGRLLYEQGKYGEAVAQWSSLEDALEAASPMRAQIAEVRRLLDSLSEARRSAQTAERASGEALPAPADSREFLDGAVSKLGEQVRAAQDSRARAQEVLASRQRQVSETFAKGRKLYEAGDHAAAFAEWQRIAPELADAEWFSVSIEKLKAQTASAGELKALAQAAASTKPELTPEIRSAFGQLEQALAASAEESRQLIARKQGEIAQLSDRSAQALRRGRELFVQGEYEAALAVWKDIGQWIPEARPAIDALQARLGEWTEARRAADHAAAAGFEQLKAEAGPIRESMEKASAELEARALQARQQRETLEKDLGERQAWVTSTFEKGLKLVAEKRYREAASLWKSLVPYLEEPSAIESMLERVLKADQDAAAAVAAAEEASARASSKIAPPAQLAASLAELEKSLVSLTGQAERSRLESQKALQARQQALRSADEEARRLLAAGDTEGALRAWAAITDQIEDAQQWTAEIEKTAAALARSREAASAASAAEARKLAALPAPEGLAVALVQTQQQLRQQADERSAWAERIEREVQDKQLWAATTAQEGKRLYEAGKFDEAVAAWRSLVPHLEGGQEIEASLQSMEASRAAALRAERLAVDAAARQEALFPAPASLTGLLRTADAQFGERARVSEEAAAQSLRALEARRASVEQVLRSATSLASEGRHPEALQVVEGILPQFAEQEDLRQRVQAARQMHARSEEAAQAARIAAEQQTAKLPLPEELPKLLSVVEEALRVELQSAEQERARMTQAAADRRAWIDRVFAEGQARFTEGKTGEALAEWSKLLPYMDDASGIKERLSLAKQGYSQALEAKKSAVQFAAAELKNIPVPQELAASLEKAESSLRAETERARAEMAAAQERLAQRQERLAALAKEGREHFAAGRAAEALAAWERLASELPAGAPERARINDLKASLALRETSAREAAQAAAAAAQPQPMPAGSTEWIEQQLRALHAQKQGFDAEAARSAQAALDKQAALHAAFEKGRAFYEQKNYPEAVREWRSMVPLVDEGSPLKGLLEGLKTASAQLEESRIAADAARRAEAARLPAPAALSDLLIEADTALRKQLAETRQQRASSEEGMAARRAQAAALFEKGQALYKQGRVGEALVQWQGLLELVESSPALASSLSDLKARWEESESARQGLEQLQASRPLPPPGFVESIDQAQSSLAAAALKAREEQARLEKEAQQREQAVTASFTEADKLFRSGRAGDALSKWREAAALLGDAGLLQKVSDLEKAYEASQQEKKAADDLAATRFKELKVPSAEFERSLAESLERLRSEEAASVQQRQQMEKTFAERQAWVNATYEKAQAAYQGGRLQEALDLWASLAPALDSSEKAQAQIARVRESLAAAEQAERAASAAVEAGKQPFRSPEGLLESLEQVRAQLAESAKSSTDRRAAAEKEREDKRLWVQFTFQDGMNLYQTGKVEEALKLWRTLLPHLENAAAIEASIAAAEKERAASLEAARATEEAVARQNSKLEAPSELEALLVQARQKLSEEAVASQAQRTQAERIVTERSQWIEAAFQKGKGFYDAGRYPEAIHEWSAILPYVEGGEELDAMLTKLTEAYDSMREAEGGADQARQAAEAKLEMPSDLLHVVGEAALALRERTRKTMATRDELQRGQQSRREAMETHLRKGQMLYESGLLDEAVAEWRALIPFFDDTAALEKQLADIAASRKLLEQALQETDAVRVKQTARLAVPEGLAPYLDKVDEAFKKEAFEAQAERSKFESSYQEKQQWISATFAQGKLFYDQGLYKEAADEWSKLVPYTDEAADLRGRLEAVWASHREAMEAKKAAVEAVAGEYQGLKLQYTPQMVELLQRANAKIKSEAEASLRKRSEVEASIAERKEWTLTTFNKGKIFYEQGRMDEALDQWGRLAPYLEAGSPLKQLIETLKVRYNEYQTAQQMSEGLSVEKADAESQAAMQAFFSDASATLAKKASEAQRAAEEASRVMAKRKEWITASYEKGRELYSQGRFTEAIRQWEVLQPYLSEAPELQTAVAEAMSKAQKAAQAIQAAEEAKAKQAEAITMPEQPAQAVVELVPPTQVAAEAAAEPALAKPVVVPDDAVFVSGEVTAVDTQGRTLTMKLYTVNKEKSLVIQFDQSTRVEGSQDGIDVSALQAGSAIDLRYDARTNKAYYIYVY